MSKLVIFCLFAFVCVICESATIQEEADIIEEEEGGEVPVGLEEDIVPRDDCSAAFYPVTACVKDGTRFDKIFSIIIWVLEFRSNAISVAIDPVELKYLLNNLFFLFVI